MAQVAAAAEGTRRAAGAPRPPCKHFLHIDDWSRGGVSSLLKRASEVRECLRTDGSFKPLSGRSLAMIFTKPSARTRVSFETGFAKMGGQPIYLGPDDIQLGEREETRDIARVLSRYNDVIMARLFEHSTLLDLAEHSLSPVINGLTDYNHPCQIAADALTVVDAFGSLENRRVCYVGDGNNVTHSWLRLASVVPFHLTIACPVGFEPRSDVVQFAQNAGLSTINVVHDAQEGARNAEVVYTDVWASMGHKAELSERVNAFNGFTVGDQVMQQAAADAIFMHCLPAERGKECMDSVMESEQSWVFQQAENRMHAQNALMLECLGL